MSYHVMMEQADKQSLWAQNGASHFAGRNPAAALSSDINWRKCIRPENGGRCPEDADAGGGEGPTAVDSAPFTALACLASLQDATVPGGSSPPLASVSWALKCSPLAAATEGLLLWYRACSAKGLFTS